MPEGPERRSAADQGRSSPDTADVLVCDLDGTVVGINTFPAFVGFALRQLVRQREVGPALQLLGALAARKVLRRPHLHLKAVVCRLAPRMEEASLQRWADGIVRDHGLPPVLALLASWPGPTYLCTAAPEHYAVRIGAALGVDHVQGTVAAHPVVENSRAHKAIRLSEVVDTPVDTAVTDDDDLDAELLALARTRLLVVDGELRPQHPT